MQIEPKKHIKDIKRPLDHKNNRLNYLRLDGNELAPHINSSIFKEIKNRLTENHISAYPELSEVYMNLANYLGVSVDNLIITPGSELGIKQIFETFCYENDEVIIVHPTYGMFKGYCEIMNLNNKIVNIDAELSIDVKAIIAAVTNDTKIITVANPNGNTGSNISDTSMIELINFCEEKSILLLIDQAYIEFLDTKLNLVDSIDDYNSVILVRTFSKAMGLAGLRIGYIVTNKKLRKFIFSTKAVHEVNSIAALAVNIILEDKLEIVKKEIDSLKSSKNKSVKALEDIGVKTYYSSGNFIHVWLGRKKKRVLEELRKEKILVKDNGDNSILAGSIRITIAPWENMKQVISIIKEVIKDD